MSSIKLRLSIFALTILSFLFSASIPCFSQEYKVESFSIVQSDLTARTNPKVDNNGKKCALIKVYADDKIAAVRGNIIGDVSTLGMEKSFYLTDGTRQIEIVFENHYPLKIVFDDYNIPALTGAMTYVLKLKSDSNTTNTTAASKSEPQNAKEEPKPSTTSASQQNAATAHSTPNYGIQSQSSALSPYSPPANPNISQDWRSLYENGKQFFWAYDKDWKRSFNNPNSIDKLKMGSNLLNGYKDLANAYGIISNPDRNGKVDSKTIKDISKIIKDHANDFFISGADFFNAKKLYPEAYECFIIYADMPVQEFMRETDIGIKDEDRATAYFNAGLAAYTGDEIFKSADAFRKARNAGYDDKQAYIYEIACWQAASRRDENMEQTANEKIFEIAEAGYKKYGTEEPLFFNNIIDILVKYGKNEEAINKVSQQIARYPDNANLYGLRGFVYDRMEKDEQSVEDYIKAASLEGVDFETLKNAAKKVYTVGTEKLQSAPAGNSTESIEARRKIKIYYFEKAKNIAKRAKTMKADDSDLDYLIESIDYTLSNSFN